MNRLQRLDAPAGLPGHPERRTSAGRPGHGDRPDGRTSTRSTPRSRSPRSARLPELNDGRHRLRRRLPRLGIPRGRLRAPASRGRALGVGERTLVTRRRCTPGRRRRGDLRFHDPPRPSRPLRHDFTLPQLPVARRPRRPAAAARLAAAAGRLRVPRPPRRPAPQHPRQRRRLPRRARHRPGGGRVLHARQRPGARLRLQPDQRLLVPRRDGRAGAASSPRCTTPTASGTATCCAPTSAAGRSTAKEFYVSPFFDGRRPLPDAPARAGRPAALPSRLRRTGAAPRSSRRCAAAAAGHRAACWRGCRATLVDRAVVPLRIRWQGIRLWAARPAVMPRPAPPPAPARESDDPSSPTRPGCRRGRDHSPCRPPGQLARRAPVPGPRGLRAAVARLLFASVAGRLPLRIDLPGRRRSSAAAARRPAVLRCTARRRSTARLGAGGPDRLRRGLHGRRLGRRRPGRPAHRRSPARWPTLVPPRAAAAAPLATSRTSRRPSDNTDERRPAQHPPPLRPVQRPVRALPRPDA